MLKTFHSQPSDFITSRKCTLHIGQVCYRTEMLGKVYSGTGVCVRLQGELISQQALFGRAFRIFDGPSSFLSSPLGRALLHLQEAATAIGATHVDSVSFMPPLWCRLVPPEAPFPPQRNVCLHRMLTAAINNPGSRGSHGNVKMDASEHGWWVGGVTFFQNRSERGTERRGVGKFLQSVRPSGMRVWPP